MSLDRRAVCFIEELAKTFLKEKEKHGRGVSAKDVKCHFKRSVSSLAQGRLQRELCKYSPLYCKRFQRCVRNLMHRVGASQGTVVTSNGSKTQSTGGDATMSPTAQQSPEVECEKKVLDEEKPCCAQETKEGTPDRDDRCSGSTSHKLTVSSHPPELVHPRKQSDVTKKKNANIGNSKNVSELSRALTSLCHRCDHSSLTALMNHAVGLFSVEVTDILTSKDTARASDVLSCLHRVMLYFHFKCDIIHTDKKQVSTISKDSLYKQHMATMLSLYCSLNILIARSESQRSHRMAQQALLKACLLLDGSEQLMDVVLQLSVKLEPVDAPYLYPTLMHALKHPPYPFKSSSYLKHILVCRLARYILPQNQYPDLTKQLQASLSLLPPDDLNTWLTDHCPHLTSEISSYANGHQMTSYLLQIASYDLCHQLQQSLYCCPGSVVSLSTNVESAGEAGDSADSADFSGAVNSEGDHTVIVKHKKISLEEELGNHSKESKGSIPQVDCTDPSRPAEDAAREMCKDVDDNFQTESRMSADEPSQNGIPADTSSTSKEVKMESAEKAKAVKALPQGRKGDEVGKEVLEITQEVKSDEKQSKGTASDVSFADSKVNRKSKKRTNHKKTITWTGKIEVGGQEFEEISQGSESKEKRLQGTDTSDDNKNTDRNSEIETKAVELLPEPGNRGERVLMIAQGKESEKKESETTEMDDSSDGSVLRRCEKDLMHVKLSSMPSGLHLSKNEKERVVDFRSLRSRTRKNSACLESSKLGEDCVIPDSCDEETGSVDIIYDSEVEHSGHLQQKMALRKARQLRSLLSSADSSKSVMGSDRSRVVTRSRYRKSLADASTVQASREKRQGNPESTPKKRKGSQAVSPVLEDEPHELITVRLVHIDRYRGLAGRAKEVETGKGNSSPVFKHASQIRKSPVKLGAISKWDCKNDVTKELPKSLVSLDSAKRKLNPPAEGDSNCRRSPRKLNYGVQSEIKRCPLCKQIGEDNILGDQLVDCPKSVSPVEKDFKSSKDVASHLRRSPRKVSHQDKSENVIMEDLSVDSHKSPTSPTIQRIQRTDTKEVVCLRKSPRKRNLEDKLEFTDKEILTGPLVDPYELTFSSDSAVGNSRTSISMTSSIRGNRKDKSHSPAGEPCPKRSSSYKEKLRQLRTSVGTEQHSLRKDVVKVASKPERPLPPRNEKGQFVSIKKSSPFVGLKAPTASSGNCPSSPKSSLSQFTLLRKRSFSEDCDDQSSSLPKVLTSGTGSSEGYSVLRSRVSLKKIGIVPPYNQPCDSRPPQGEFSAGVMTPQGIRTPESRKAHGKDISRSSGVQSSLSRRNSGSRTADMEDSPGTSGVRTSVGGRSFGSRAIVSKNSPRTSGVKTSFGGWNSGSRTTDSEVSPRRSGIKTSIDGRGSGRRSIDCKDTPRSSKIKSGQGVQLRSSPRVRLFRKALDFE